MKCCRSCEKSKPQSAFPKSGTRNGRQRYRGECKKCFATYLRDWSARNKERARGNTARYVRRAAGRIRQLKEDASCADCHVMYPWYVYDFDHRGDAPKLKNVSRLKSASVATQMAEIAKCDIVCANCHRIRTHKRREAKKLLRGADGDVSSGS